MKIETKSSISGTIFLILLLVSGYLLLENHLDENQQWSKTTKPDAINAVIGDESYRAKFGVEPNEATPEKARILIHLKYVQQKLLNREVEFLTDQQEKNRLKHLKRLTDYIQRGVFPENNAFPNQHRPNFIDSEGRICAVGYLIEQSMGREAAESINEEYQYEYVFNMGSKFLEKWAHRNGFTVRELAMIQPAYCFSNCGEEQGQISKSAESILIGANVGLSLANCYWGLQQSGKAIPASASIALGASTITLGLTDHANFSTMDYITGGLSIAAGGWALHSIFNKKSSSNNLTIAPVPDARFDGNIGVSINYQF